jgi:hypothetical protein
MDALKSKNNAVNQKMFQSVDRHRWEGASDEEIRKLIEKKTLKKYYIEYPVTVIIHGVTKFAYSEFRV